MKSSPGLLGTWLPSLLSYLLQLDTVLGGVEALAEFIYFFFEECPHFTEA